MYNMYIESYLVLEPSLEILEFEKKWAKIESTQSLEIWKIKMKQPPKTKPKKHKKPLRLEVLLLWKEELANINWNPKLPMLAMTWEKRANGCNKKKKVKTVHVISPNAYTSVSMAKSTLWHYIYTKTSSLQVYSCSCLQGANYYQL
jgi:hypothetical protein